MQRVMTENGQPRIDLERQITGLVYGLIGALTYTLLAWGYDAYLLYQAGLDTFWMKVAAGGLFCLLVGGFIGWLAAKLDSGLIASVGWLLAGIAFAWFASHVPFQVSTAISQIIDPRFRGIDLFPYPESQGRRMIIVYSFTVMAIGIGGVLQTVLVESALHAGSWLMRVLPLLVCVPLFAIAGKATDNINELMREPAIGMHTLIENGRKYQGQTPDPRTVATLHLRTAEAFREQIDQPYRLIFGSYDPDYLTSYTLYLDIGGKQFTCAVMMDNPSNCTPSQELFAGGLACLLNGGTGCSVKAEPATMLDWQEQVGAVAAAGVIAQRGNTTLVEVENTSQQRFECRVTTLGLPTLETCALITEEAFPAALLKPYPPEGTPGASNPASVATPPPRATRLPAQTQAASTVVLPGIDTSQPWLRSAPRYTLSIDVNYKQHTFRGTAAIDYTNAEDVPLDSVYFRLIPNGHSSYGNGSLTVSSVKAGGKEAKTELSHENTALQVRLPEALQPGEKTRFEMAFQGEVPVDFGGSATPEGYGIYNLTDDVLALDAWYPILAVYDKDGWHLDPVSGIGDSVFSDTGYYTVTLSAPAGLIAATTGVQLSQDTLEGTTRRQIASGPARDFFITLSPNFEVSSRTVAGTKINSYYLPGSSTGGKEALRTAANSLAVYNQKFGVYPMAELDVVQAPMRNASGVEFPGIVLIGSSLYEQPGEPDFSVTVAHEVAHQWWYSTVGNDVFADPWMDEALTSYSSSLVFEFGGDTAMANGLVEYWQGRYDQTKQRGLDDAVAESLNHFESLNDPRVYGGVVYVKGALFFHALREEIGDAAFFDALESYYRQEAFGIAQPQDLLGAFEKSAGRSLASFYQAWLYEPVK